MDEAGGESGAMETLDAPDAPAVAGTRRRRLHSWGEGGGADVTDPGATATAWTTAATAPRAAREGEGREAWGVATGVGKTTATTPQRGRGAPGGSAGGGRTGGEAASVGSGMLPACPLDEPMTNTCSHLP